MFFCFRTASLGGGGLIRGRKEILMKWRYSALPSKSSVSRFVNVRMDEKYTNSIGTEHIGIVSKLIT